MRTLKCDQCGKVEKAEPRTMLQVERSEVGFYDEERDELHFCSWRCLKEYAEKKDKEHS